MYKLILSIVFVLATHLWPTCIKAQNPVNYRFQYLLIEDGLPQNTITCITKDNYGFMWFGTNNGVCRYDSYNFEQFKANEATSNALPDNLISAIQADPNNLVWVGSSKGLSYFDPYENLIKQFTDTNSFGEKITKVSSILVHKNQIWVATSSRGVYVLKPTTKGYTISQHFCVGKNNIGSNQISVIYSLKNNVMYAGCENGYFILSADSKKFNTPEPANQLPPQTIVNDIFADDKENLYFSTMNGMFIQSENTKAISWYSANSIGPNSLKHGSVNMVRQDITGQILVASLGGLQMFDIETGKFNSLAEDGPDNFKINNEFVNTLFCDNSGNVWIGTEKGGINKYNIFQNPFGFFTNNPNDPNSLNENTINSILKEKDLLWIGTAGGGVNLYDPARDKFHHFKYSSSNFKSLSSDYITSMVRATDNIIYVGTWGGGLNKLITRGTQVAVDRITLADPEYSNNLVNGFISSLVDNSLGYLLIGTEGGLSMLDYKRKKFTTLIAPVDHALKLTEIGCMLLDSKGFYWIGTRNGLFRFPQSSIRDTKDDEFIISQLEYYNHEPNKASSLPGDYIISLTEDSKANVWIGTYGNGLAKSLINFNGEMVFENFTTADGLSNNVIYGIQEDKHNKIWISTDYGLSVLNTINNNTRNFYKQDGLLNNQFYWSASHKGSDGNLYFGGIEGLNYFNPENFYEYNYFPTPKIIKFHIYNEEVLPDIKFHNKVAITKPVYAVDTIKLGYKDNNISFDFSSFDYYLPEKSQFAYKLSGIDKDWVTVSAQRRFANYNNLEGGIYTFQLKASNCDGVWNEEPTVVTIIITPPFWKTTWFTIVLFILLSLLTYLFIMLQMRRIIAQKKILEEKVKHRTQKIEDQKIILEKQASELQETNSQLENRQKLIEQQKEELETKNEEILIQRDELILLNEKVHEINQLQLRFFTNISHEFQTPLTLIISPIERLILQLENDAEKSHVLKIIYRNAHRLLLLIRQLLEIRKIETGNQTLQVEMTDAECFILDIFNSFEDLAQKNKITYTHEIEVNKSSWIDKDKLENVLYNLLSNAFKFTPENKSITLKAKNIRKNDKDLLCISVIDTGEGIAPEKINKLFDRFLQVTESKKHKRAGTGIGLSLVKSLVEIMYGTITVESTPDLGSKFTVEIPINKQVFADHEIDTTGQIFESQIKDKVALLSDHINEPKETEYHDHEAIVDKILVVEDNVDMRSFMCSNLSQFYTVIEADNGLKGYEQAKKEAPAIIISDIMMPEMNGLELCKKLKNNLYTSHIPIVLLTARSRTEDHIEGLEVGADDYITKPFNIEILLAKIKTIIGNRNKLRAKFGKLEDVNPEELTISTLDSKFFTKANEIVQKFYTDPAFDVDQFASEMFVSRSQLYSKLKAITNLSANEFINTYRLKKSLEMLTAGELQISEIAYATGFNDPKYFSRIFKKYFKKSPSDYLKR